MNGLNFHDEMISKMNETHLCVSLSEQRFIEEIRADARADVIDEYNGYRRKVINIATTEDFGQLKRVATVDISESLIKELSQEDLLRVIVDEIAEQLKEQKL